MEKKYHIEKGNKIQSKAYNNIIVRTQFLRGPIMMLGSHMKDPSQYDL